MRYEHNVMLLGTSRFTSTIPFILRKHAPNSHLDTSSSLNQTYYDLDIPIHNIQASKHQFPALPSFPPLHHPSLVHPSLTTSRSSSSISPMEDPTSSSCSSSSSSPLINSSPNPSSNPYLNALSSSALLTLSLSRVLFGTAAILTPKHLSTFCGLPFSPAVSPILLRLFGSRDAAMGVYLWQTRHDVEARRPALLLGLAVDVVDVGGALASYLAYASTAGGGGGGGLPVKPAVIVGGGALVLAVLGAGVLRADGWNGLTRESERERRGVRKVVLR